VKTIDLGDVVRRWSRKIHIYVGLYFLLFVWLFSISGLLLNHPKWDFATFWPLRKEATYRRPVVVAESSEDSQKAGNLMSQMGIDGEIQQMTSYPDGRFKFQAARPGHIVEVMTNASSDTATVKEISTNAWGIVHMLHSFNGVDMNRLEKRRDWMLTRVWVFSTDALCAGLLVLVVSGIYMWLGMAGKRGVGLMSLLLGILGCGVFVFALG